MQQKQRKASGTAYVPQQNYNNYFDITVPPYPPLKVIENRYYRNRKLQRRLRACRILLPVTCLVAACCLCALIVLQAGLSAQHSQYMALNQRSMSLATEMDTLNSELSMATSRQMIEYEAENTLNMYIPER